MIQLYIFFHILFHYSLLQDIKDSSLCYTVGSCCLSILYVIVCIYQPQTPSPSLSPPPSLRPSPLAPPSLIATRHTHLVSTCYVQGTGPGALFTPSH